MIAFNIIMVVTLIIVTTATDLLLAVLALL